MTYHQSGRVDIAQGQHTLTAGIGDQIILSKSKGKPWPIAEHAGLQDVITCAVALLRFEGGEQ